MLPPEFLVAFCSCSMGSVIVAILLPDARELSDDVLEALRLRALRGCELGFTEADVASQRAVFVVDGAEVAAVGAELLGGQGPGLWFQESSAGAFLPWSYAESQG